LEEKGNSAQGDHSVIVGGRRNKIKDGKYSVITGGLSNEIYGDYDTIEGGEDNEVEDELSSIVGGIKNVAGKKVAFIGDYCKGRTNCQNDCSIANNSTLLLSKHKQDPDTPNNVTPFKCIRKKDKPHMKELCKYGCKVISDK